MSLPADIENIILTYKYQLEHHDKKQKVLDEIKKIKIYHIGMCLHCRHTKIIDLNNYKYNLNEDSECNHFFYLIKSVYYLHELKLFKYGLFDFFCQICNMYDGFFSHIHSQ